jgi:hypothetical protein
MALKKYFNRAISCGRVLKDVKAYCRWAGVWERHKLENPVNRHTARRRCAMARQGKLLCRNHEERPDKASVAGMIPPLTLALSRGARGLATDG